MDMAESDNSIAALFAIAEPRADAAGRETAPRVRTRSQADTDETRRKRARTAIANVEGARQADEALSPQARVSNSQYASADASQVPKMRPNPLEISNMFGEHQPPDDIVVDPDFCFLCELRRVTPTVMTVRWQANIRLLVAKSMHAGLKAVCNEVRAFYEHAILPLVSDQRLRRYWTQEMIGRHIFDHASRPSAALQLSYSIMAEVRNCAMKEVRMTLPATEDAPMRHVVDHRNAHMLLKYDNQMMTRHKELVASLADELAQATAELEASEDKAMSSYNAARDMENSGMRQTILSFNRSRRIDR